MAEDREKMTENEEAGRAVDDDLMGKGEDEEFEDVDDIDDEKESDEEVEEK